jgi:outer membrane receptor protein involved in Fe transport
VSGTKSNLSYALSGSYLTSDGYRDNSDTEAKDLGANLSYYVGDRLRLNLSGDYHEDDTGLPGAIKKSEFEAGASRTDSVHPDDFADVKDYYIKATPEIFFLNDSLFKMDFSFRKRDSLFFSSFSGGTFEGDTEIETVAVSPQIVLKEKLFGFNNSLTLGFDFVNAEEDITNTTMFLGFPMVGIFELEKKNYGYYIHDEIYLLDSLAISGGYRYDKAEFTFKPSTPDRTEMSEDLYTAGINYNFYKKSYAYFSFSHSLRYPVIDELFNFFTNTIDTGLMPQT